MIAWILLAATLTACVLLGLFIRQQSAVLREMRKDYEERLDHLAKREKEMLATALEARAITLVDPERPAEKQITAPQSISAKIRERMAELAEKDRRKAIEQEAELAERTRSVIDNLDAPR